MISRNFIYIQAVITVIFFIGCSEEDADNPAPDFSVNWQNSVLLSTENHEAAITTQINDCISISGNYVHTVWASAESKENGNVYYRRSTDNGGSWEAPKPLEISDYSVGGIVIDSWENHVYVVWKQVYDSPDGKLYFIVSHDNGGTWSEKIKISKDGIDRSSAPNIASKGESVYVTWENYILIDGSEKGNVSLRTSHNNGESWSEVQDISEILEGGPYMTIAGNGDLNLIFVSNNFDVQETQRYNWEIMYNKSTDRGKIWPSQPERLTDDYGDSRFPTADCEGENIHVVWWDDMHDTIYEHIGYPPIKPEPDHNYEIYYLKSENNGESWGEIQRLTHAQGVSADPSIKVKDNFIGVVFGDNRTGKDGIYFKYSSDNGESWSDDILIDETNRAQHPSLDIDDQGNVYVVWTAKPESTLNVYCKKAVL